jgi:hypothetical protein
LLSNSFDLPGIYTEESPVLTSREQVKPRITVQLEWCQRKTDKREMMKKKE